MTNNGPLPGGNADVRSLKMSMSVTAVGDFVVWRGRILLFGVGDFVI